MTSVSFFYVFIVKEKCPPGVLARFYRPGVGVLNSFLSGGWGICPSKKLPGDFAGGMVRLGID